MCSGSLTAKEGKYEWNDSVLPRPGFGCCGVGALFFVTGSPLWAAVLTSGIIFALFLWAPHSGRYAVHPELGITALRRDERTQAIADRAARNAFVVTMLVMAGIVIYFGSIAQTDVPVRLLYLILVLGALTYFASDLWQRRR